MLDLATLEYVDPGASNVNITSTSLVDIPGISTTYTNKYSVPIRIKVTLDFMALGNGLAGAFIGVNVDGITSVLRFLSVINAIWTTVSKDFYFTIPAGKTVAIKPQAKVGNSQSFSWGRDNSDPAFRTRIIVQEVSAA